MYKELERVLSESDSGISIKKAINSINKMYEIVLEDKNGNKKSILLKKNAVQQEIIEILHHFY
jgi:hypothetical protein